MAISEIVSSFKLLLELVGKRESERTKAALLLDAMSRCIEDVVEVSQVTGHLPVDRLEEFAIYCQRFNRAVGGSMTKETKAQVAWLLSSTRSRDKEAWERGVARSALGFDRDSIHALTEDELVALKRASGALRAYANVLRTSGSAV